ncbi:MAG: prepilin-type N-terminal cleavage/methylation domain-containing protein [Nitrospirota bacterium]
MNNNRGFTLIELVILIIILGIIASISALMIAELVRSYTTGRDISESQVHGQTALERIARELREIRADDNPSPLPSRIPVITTFTVTTLEFRSSNISNPPDDSQGDLISFSWSGNAGDPLVFTLNGTSSNLATNVQSLQFKYYDIDGNETSTVNQIAYIEVALKVGNNDAKTRIFIRDLF